MLLRVRGNEKRVWDQQLPNHAGLLTPHKLKPWHKVKQVLDTQCVESMGRDDTGNPDSSALATAVYYNA